MSQPWWGKEAGAQPGARMVTVKGSTIKQPELATATRSAVARELRARIKFFTPEWTNQRSSDAGVALIRLFSEQAEPVLTRLNRFPEKAFIEFLNIAGVQTLPATPAKTVLEFSVSDSAPQSVLVSRGFQIGAQPAVGSGDMVIFETERDLYAAPAKIEEAYSQQGSLFLEVDTAGKDPNASFTPFGKRGGPGRALLIGLSGEVVPAPMLSLGIGVAAPPGTPPPNPAGGIAPLPVEPAPMLQWEILDGASYQPLEVVLDETGGLVRSGVVELRMPRQWRIGLRPEGLTGDKPLRWMRLRIIFGQYKEGPTLSFIKLNMVSAIAARTIRNEVLEPVANSRGKLWRLSQTPILPQSLILQVDEGSVDEGGFDLDSDLREPDQSLTPESAGSEKIVDEQSSTKARVWKEVEDLEEYGPEARVYVINYESGELAFGDGVHGAAIPPGFRNVRAASYRVGGGAAGAVQAEAVNTQITSVPFINGVKNPQPASGGTDTESQQSTLRRGPQEIRARGRAVAVADYELIAMRATGAQVARAHAVAGLHPSFPGRPIPGVVGVFVVPPDRNEGQPTPDEGTLRAVAEYLSNNFAPAGVEVVAAAPRYHKIRAEVGIVVNPSADEGDTVRSVLKTLDAYFHPLTGGDDETGWPFGGTIRNAALVRRLLKVAGVNAVSRLNLVLDGNRVRGCTDVPIDPHTLLWPEEHQVIVVDPREGL
ncbi:MAG TPA: putative baseplate assembly protein [Pyrinomonadaceae bacterium]|nr:putative baseplate assembly protein [Pyrinomonadaceae bacterium]